MYLFFSFPEREFGKQKMKFLKGNFIPFLVSFYIFNRKNNVNESPKGEKKKEGKI